MLIANVKVVHTLMETSLLPCERYGIVITYGMEKTLVPNLGYVSSMIKFQFDVCIK